jgi:hypothetical protein
VIHRDGAVRDLLFFPAGVYLGSASRNRVIVTNTESGEPMAELRIHGDQPRLAIAAAVGLVLIADDQDGLTMWDWRSGQTKRVVSAEHRIQVAATTPDGTLAVTASKDGVLTLWNLATGIAMERKVRPAGTVDNLWIPANSDKVIVHSGHWLQSLSMYPVGLVPYGIRLLPGSPAAVQPDLSGRFAFVLLHPYSARPIVRELRFDRIDGRLLDGSADELQQIWQSKLALRLNTAGDLEPL